MAVKQYLINGQWVDQLPPGWDEEGIQSRFTEEGWAQHERNLSAQQKRDTSYSQQSEAQAAANWAVNQQAAGQQVTAADYYRTILRREPPPDASTDPADPRAKTLATGGQRFLVRPDGSIQDRQGGGAAVYASPAMMPPELRSAYEQERALFGNPASPGMPPVAPTTPPTSVRPPTNATPPGALPANPELPTGNPANTPTPGQLSSPTPNPSVPPGVDPYLDFKNKFRVEMGREISQSEMNDNDFLLGLLDRHGSLFLALPAERLVQFPTYELAKLPPEAMLKILRSKGTGSDGKPYDGSSLLRVLSIEQLTTLAQTPEGRDYLTLEAIPYFRANGLPDTVTNINAWLSANPTAGRPTAPGAPGTPGTGTAEPIPSTHDWVTTLGAQDWYYKQRAAGIPPEQITIALLRQSTTADWQRRAADPKFAQLYRYAQQYFAATGWWPTAVELNQYTAKMPGVPNLSPSGEAMIPKANDAGSAEGATEKWKVPMSADGVTPQPLPPGYEWRFSADGTPTAFKSDQAAAKDLFSGWYQDPKTGGWSYNPILGSADYLQSSDPTWLNTVNGFVGRTGRLPTRDEARALAASVWAQAGTEGRIRAEQFAALNGFWPTPWELEFGASKDLDANADGSGGSGQAGLGTVMVNIPGVGMRAVSASQALKMGIGDPGLTSGQLTVGNFALDPFQGIPAQARVWVKAVLDGGITTAQVPPEVAQWVNFALKSVQSQLPTYKPPTETPGFGAGSPTMPSPSNPIPYPGQPDAPVSAPAPGSPNAPAPAPAPTVPTAPVGGGTGAGTVAPPGWRGENPPGYVPPDSAPPTVAPPGWRGANPPGYVPPAPPDWGNQSPPGYTPTSPTTVAPPGWRGENPPGYVPSPGGEESASDPSLASLAVPPASANEPVDSGHFSLGGVGGQVQGQGKKPALAQPPSPSFRPRSYGQEPFMAPNRDSNSSTASPLPPPPGTGYDSGSGNNAVNQRYTTPERDKEWQTDSLGSGSGRNKRKRRTPALAQPPA